MKVFAVRHGATEANEAGIIMGQIDTPLTNEGLANAKMMARECEELVDVEHIYCSDIGRALITAEIIAEGLGLLDSVTPTPALRELDYGEASEKSKKQILENYPTYHSDPDFCFPNGESLREVQHRASLYLKELARDSRHEAILVVTHSGVLRALAAASTGENLELWSDREFSHQCIIGFEVTGSNLGKLDVIKE